MNLSSTSKSDFLESKRCLFCPSIAINGFLKIPLGQLATSFSFYLARSGQCLFAPLSSHWKWIYPQVWDTFHHLTLYFHRSGTRFANPGIFNRLLGPASDKEQCWKSFSKMVRDSRGVKIQAGGRKRCQWDLFVVAFVAGVLPLTIIICCLFIIFTCLTSKLRHITIRKENLH